MPQTATAAQSFQNVDNTFTLLARALAPATPRADLVEFFEGWAEWHDDQAWVTVDVVVDLILDNQELAALIRPESISSATPRKEQ